MHAPDLDRLTLAELCRLLRRVDRLLARKMRTNRVQMRTSRAYRTHARRCVAMVRAAVTARTRS